MSAGLPYIELYSIVFLTSIQGQSPFSVEKNPSASSQTISEACRGGDGGHWKDQQESVPQPCVQQASTCQSGVFTGPSYFTGTNES